MNIEKSPLVVGVVIQNNIIGTLLKNIYFSKEITEFFDINWQKQDSFSIIETYPSEFYKIILFLVTIIPSLSA